MNRFKLALFALLAICAGAMPALALSTQEGTASSGAYNMNLADPDEQAPAFVKPSQDQSASSNHFDSSGGNSSQPVIIHGGTYPLNSAIANDPYLQQNFQR